MREQHRAGTRMPRAVRLAGCLTASIMAVPSVHAAAYYVDGANGQPHATGSMQSPFPYFYQAAQAAQPGDVIYLMPTTVYPYLSISISGSAGYPITVAGAGLPPNLTQVVGTTAHFAAWINGNYIILRNFDLTAPGTRSGVQVPAGRHHITITNNVVHGSGGNGISTVNADYLTISHNVVFGNSWNTTNNVFGSGISTLQNTDTNTGTKVLITGNLIYGNTNTPGCTPQPACLPATQDVNGNGIIIDDYRHSETDHNAYRGATRITNNVVFGNGGRGIYVYQSDHVTIASNTAYFNNQDPYEGNYRPGEIQANYGGAIKIYDNVMYSDGGTGIGGGINTGAHTVLSLQYCTVNTGPLLIQNNVMYDTQNDGVQFVQRANTVPLSAAANIWADPRFANPTLNPATADFRPLAGSPALGAAVLATSASYDYLNVQRTVPTTAGAFQNAVASSGSASPASATQR